MQYLKTEKVFKKQADARKFSYFIVKLFSITRNVTGFIPFGFILVFLEVPLFRSSCPEVFCKKGVLNNFAKFTGKHLCQSLFFNKVANLRSASLLKNESDTGVFP